MNKLFTVVIASLVFSGCSLSLNEIRARKAACLAEGGDVRIHVDKYGSVYSVSCVVEGLEFRVTKAGELR